MLMFDLFDVVADSCADEGNDNNEEGGDLPLMDIIKSIDMEGNVEMSSVHPPRAGRRPCIKYLDLEIPLDEDT